MSFRDKLKSAGESLNAAKVAKDAARLDKANTRPDWVPADHPEGVPIISLDAAYVGRDIPVVTDSVTHRVLTEDEVDAVLGKPLTDAQRVGATVVGALALAQLPPTNPNNPKEKD